DRGHLHVHHRFDAEGGEIGRGVLAPRQVHGAGGGEQGDCQRPTEARKKSPLRLELRHSVYSPQVPRTRGRSSAGNAPVTRQNPLCCARSPVLTATSLRIGVPENCLDRLAKGFRRETPPAPTGAEI